MFALALLSGCETPSGPTDSSLPNNCGSGTGFAAPAPCARPRSPSPGGCRNMLVMPVCMGGAYQCPAATVNRVQCTCFDEQCEVGVDGGDASMDDAAATDSSNSADSAMDASGAD